MPARPLATTLRGALKSVADHDKAAPMQAQHHPVDGPEGKPDAPSAVTLALPSTSAMFAPGYGTRAELPRPARQTLRGEVTPPIVPPRRRGRRTR